MQVKPTNAQIADATPKKAASLLAQYYAIHYIKGYTLDRMKGFVNGEGDGQVNCQPTYARTERENIGDNKCWFKYGYALQSDGGNAYIVDYAKAACRDESKDKSGKWKWRDRKILVSCFKASDISSADLNDCMMYYKCSACSIIASALIEISCTDTSFLDGVEGFVMH